MKTWFVTGAGRGLGLALAEAVVARGDFVIGTLRDKERGRGLLELAARAPAQVRAHVLDVTDEAACAALPTALGLDLDARGLDVLVNNAGVNSRSADIVTHGGGAFALEELSASALARMMATNAIGPVLVTRALAPLLARRAGVVVNVSSRRGALAVKDTGGNYGYCMSKAALNMATRALAADLAPRGITVVAVHPGAVRTAMAQADASLEPAHAAARLAALVEAIAGEGAGDGAAARTRATGRFLELDSLQTGRDHAW